ncbi:potassium transporter Kup, partial [Mesorhizobium sp. M00.F.Ca.ET.149.01.1.1]
MALANGAEAEPADQSSHAEIGQHSTKVLMLGALGVVYGDIGTSPIYAFREALHASSGGDVANRADILGVLSLIIWSLTIT